MENDPKRKMSTNSLVELDKLLVALQHEMDRVNQLHPGMEAVMNVRKIVDGLIVRRRAR
jgi:hypothetical protein